MLCEAIINKYDKTILQDQETNLNETIKIKRFSYDLKQFHLSKKKRLGVVLSCFYGV